MQFSNYVIYEILRFIQFYARTSKMNISYFLKS